MSLDSARLSAESVISPLSAEEQQIDSDYEWCLHDPEVRRVYGGQVVAVNQRRIWGAGRDHGTALQAALAAPGCPPRQALALAVVPEEAGVLLQDEVSQESPR